ncbi:hypothetical protein KOR42_32970 [Thalassoglobus neptunius]|uniref:Uncharacterized protein n=1 Tax=Thalassoglobus neptunius TaxID=1938619 RepID=A0A5C5WLZ3_9PLAN|nr:hypothetical protein [Thalassoglobus neptunius]TWT51824.1 hypothetical protein KOR42_32970 [Thalassoglobus neptunius]
MNKAELAGRIYGTPFWRVDLTGVWIVLAVLFFWLGLWAQANSAETKNFRGPDSEIVQLAEKLRAERSVYWAGVELPGNWFKPAQISWNPNGQASGATTFMVGEGEVYDFRIELIGPREEVLRDVLPHEVDHAVRLSWVRRPIARWVDEGSAQVAESQQSKARADQHARETAQHPIRWIDSMEYPDSQEILRMYSVGYSIVSYLIDSHGPERMLAFQADRRPPSEKLSEFYGTSASGLINQWRQSLDVANQDGQDSKMIQVETGLFCPPCIALKRDAGDGLFPGYRFGFSDAPLGSKVPKITYRGHIRYGYSGPAELKAWLATVEANPPKEGPVSQPYVRDGPEFDSILEDLKEVREALGPIRKDIEEFKEAGLIGKVKNLLELKAGVSELKEKVEPILKDVSSLREGLAQVDQETEEQVPWYWGLWAGLVGIVKRRYLNSGGLA